jgi:hypothetical protein
MSLLKNAVESIQVGVQDFESNDERRSVSAMRNIAAGLLLLFKTKLCELSPPSDKELLIKKDLTPGVDEGGNLVFVSKGRKTVDVTQIQERLTAMKVDVDWKRVKEITNLRNEIEHYYAEATPDAVREVVAKSFLLIRDFMQKALQLDPQDLLGNDCWVVLLKTSDVYLAEEIACQESLEKIDWKYPTIKQSLVHCRCPQCGSALIEAPFDDNKYPTINLRCKSCSADFSFSDIVENCVGELLFVETYLSATQGGETPYGSCPQCDKETFVYAESCCVACEGKLEYTQCAACEEPLSVDEQDLNGMCSYCRYKYDKVMANNCIGHMPPVV